LRTESIKLTANVTHFYFRARFAARQDLRPFIAVSVHPSLPDSTKKIFEFGIGRTRSAGGPKHIPAK